MNCVSSVIERASKRAIRQTGEGESERVYMQTNTHTHTHTHIHTHTHTTDNDNDGNNGPYLHKRSMPVYASWGLLHNMRSQHNTTIVSFWSPHLCMRIRTYTHTYMNNRQVWSDLAKQVERVVLICMWWWRLIEPQVLTSVLIYYQTWQWLPKYKNVHLVYIHVHIHTRARARKAHCCTELPT